MKQLKLFGLVIGIFIIFAGSLQAQTDVSLDSSSQQGIKDSAAISGSSNINQSADVIGKQVTSVSDNDTLKNQNSVDNRMSCGNENKNEFGHKLANGDIEYRPIGYGGVEVGQIASGYWKQPGQGIFPISHVWQQRAYSAFGYDALIKKRLEINILAGGLLAYSTPQINKAPQTQQSKYLFYLKDASAAYKIFDSDMFSLKAQAGYFPFKYSPDVRNLGEYLLRTNAYPLLVYSDFDNPKADILGARINCQLNASENFTFKNDLLLHSELNSVPVQNWSISEVLSATVFKALTIGGGISLCNLLSVYQGTYNGTVWLEDKYDKYYMTDVNGDTTEFDWKSTKVMTRMSFDPKKIIPLYIFGKNDLILYGEADVIGLKNYPRYFTDMRDRTFYSLGFNIPGFKLFDVINGEVEYCRDTSAFSDEGLYTITTSSNYTILRERDLNESSTLSSRIKRNPFRWSLYVKKSILDDHVSFIAQCACDHKKINFYYYDYAYMSYIESLPTSKNWWWAFKTEFNF